MHLLVTAQRDAEFTPNLQVVNLNVKNLTTTSRYWYYTKLLKSKIIIVHNIQLLCTTQNMALSRTLKGYNSETKSDH